MPKVVTRGESNRADLKALTPKVLSRQAGARALAGSEASGESLGVLEKNHRGDPKPVSCPIAS